jgi:thymidine kinase
MPPHRGGWLEVVCGPMYSGKSEELIRRLRRAEIAGQKVLVVKAGFDDRYDVAHVVSHGGDRIRAVCADAEAVPRLAEGYDVVGIDELHFFDETAIVDVVLELRGRGRRVIVSGLDCDFRGKPFAAMARLLCHAELVDKLQAVCHRCGGPATRTQRLVDGQPAPFAGPTILVGALDAYEARCSGCYEPGAGAPSGVADLRVGSGG